MEEISKKYSIWITRAHRPLKSSVVLNGYNLSFVYSLITDSTDRKPPELLLYTGTPLGWLLR